MQFELLIRSGPCYDSYNRSVYPATSSLPLSLSLFSSRRSSLNRTLMPSIRAQYRVEAGGNFEKHENGMVSDTGSFEAYRRW